MGLAPGAVENTLGDSNDKGRLPAAGEGIHGPDRLRGGHTGYIGTKRRSRDSFNGCHHEARSRSAISAQVAATNYPLLARFPCVPTPRPRHPVARRVGWPPLVFACFRSTPTRRALVLATRTVATSDLGPRKTKSCGGATRAWGPRGGGRAGTPGKVFFAGAGDEQPTAGRGVRAAASCRARTGRAVPRIRGFVLASSVFLSSIVALSLCPMLASAHAARWRA